MPGNETLNRSDRVFPPCFWKAVGVTSGQGTGVVMPIPGISMTGFPFPRAASLMSIGIMLSEPVTDGFLRFEVLKNGVPTGKTFDMTSATGKRQIWEFEAGKLTAGKGTEIGFQWGSNASFAPSGVIEGSETWNSYSSCSTG